jgi:hypothetical protein
LFAALTATAAAGFVALPSAPPVQAADEKPKNQKKEIEAAGSGSKGGELVPRGGPSTT